LKNFFVDKKKSVKANYRTHIKRISHRYLGKFESCLLRMKNWLLKIENLEPVNILVRLVNTRKCLDVVSMGRSKPGDENSTNSVVKRKKPTRTRHVHLNVAMVARHHRWVSTKTKRIIFRICTISKKPWRINSNLSLKSNSLTPWTQLSMLTRDQLWHLIRTRRRQVSNRTQVHSYRMSDRFGCLIKRTFYFE